MMGTFFLSDFIPFTGWIDTLRGLHARLERSFNEMDKFYQKFIDEHMDSNEKTQAEKDIVDVVLQLKKNDSSSIDLTNDNIKGLLMKLVTFAITDADLRGQNFEFIPFGAGRKICPGLNLAFATMDLILANLFYSFDWELPPAMTREDIDTEVLPGITQHKKNPLCVVAKCRV
ncbi:hypothetical protein JHK86_006191 [Glycine max]|nr:hypothetical protein JHK86_006191 [Glycine max]